MSNMNHKTHDSDTTAGEMPGQPSAALVALENAVAEFRRSDPADPDRQVRLSRVVETEISGINVAAAGVLGDAALAVNALRAAISRGSIPQVLSDLIHSRAAYDGCRGDAKSAAALSLARFWADHEAELLDTVAGLKSLTEAIRAEWVRNSLAP